MALSRDIHTYSTRSADRGTTTTALSDRTGYGALWAIFGAVWCLVMLNAWAQWLMSDVHFAPAPIAGGDHFEPWRLVALRILEAISTAVVLYYAWKAVVRPWMRQGQLGLDASLLLAGVFGWGADAMLNVHQFLFAFNAHSINMGVWTAFMPFYSGGPAIYAESLLWGAPMYVYFCLGAAYVGCALIAQLRQRFTGISDVAVYSILFLVLCIGDFAIENLIIQITQAYAFPKAYEPLTLWVGSIHQFPIYESVAVGLVGIGFTVIRQTALEHPQGWSVVERGCQRLPQPLQGPARVLAVVGACAAILLLAYHMPVNWLGLIASTSVELPSYLLPG